MTWLSSWHVRWRTGCGAGSGGYSGIAYRVNLVSGYEDQIPQHLVRLRASLTRRREDGMALAGSRSATCVWPRPGSGAESISS